MAVDIGYLSAVGAGALSFLSPCVLPLVPPYLCYMAGVSVEDFRDERRRGGAARRAHRAGLGVGRLRARLHHGVRRARRRRLDHRPLPARLAGRAGDRRRHRHHLDGTQFSRHHPHPAAVARGALPGARQAGQRRRRLCHGPCLRLRLDALHRPGARPDPDARRRPRDGRRGGAAAVRLFDRARHSRSSSRQSSPAPSCAS